MELALQVEAQSGLNWPRWKRLAQAVEDLGFAALYRSDHLINMQPPDEDALELWTSLTWLAAETKRIEFGPLVSPVSFRHPVLTAHMAAAVDDLSGGRLRLGLGAGWAEREHRAYGFDLLPLAQRFDRFEEGLEVITRLFNSREPVDFAGQYYHLEQAVLRPLPQRPGGPAVVIGGRGSRRTLGLVVKYAQEWNTFRIPVETLAELKARMDERLAAAGRDPASLRRTMMVNLVYGRDQAELNRKLEGHSVEQLREKGVVGTANEIVDQLGAYAGLGVQRVMLQWFDMDDLALLEAVATHILPQLKS